MSMVMELFGRWRAPFVIAEIAQAHDGSLGMAHSYIDAAARAGADAVKFQTHIASAESSPEEPWRVKFSPQDATRYDYWKRMEFTPEQWAGLKNHADEKGLAFISSPFSLEAADLLERVGAAAWKIASGEVNNTPLMERVLKTGLPILVSTGMSPIAEVDRAVEMIKAAGAPLAVLQCSSIYPTPPEKVGLNMIPLFRERYGCPAGLSDHSGSIFPPLAAAAMGADIVETHVVFSREMFGPDVKASITIDELHHLAAGLRFIKKMISSPVDKDAMAGELADMRALFNKSLVMAVDLAAGVRLERGHLTARKPGTGVPVGRLGEVVGKTLRRDMRAGEFLREGDFE